MTLFKNKYRTESARANWWNYGWAGAYFITICTHNRDHYFGEITSVPLNVVDTRHALYLPAPVPDPVPEPEPVPNPQSKTQYKNKMNLSHCGIIANILWYQIPHHAKNVELGAFVVMPNHIHGILILTEDSEIGLREFADDETISRFQNQGKNTVSSIIGSYKSAVTKNSNRLEYTNGWQGKFHDHIIRSDDEYRRINDYIESNVKNWKEDRFY
ncbi:transposase [Flavobacterium ardleyense]|uniref:transposase n=1 Tax=Flavobacterium ardleyense TaxID=2038737 RepID=UPI00298CB8C5|nr:transposase [Flavobacterium ardleyense]